LPESGQKRLGGEPRRPPVGGNDSWRAAALPRVYGGLSQETTLMTDAFAEIRDAAVRLCADFPGRCWRDTRTALAPRKRAYVPQIASGTPRLPAFGVTEPTTDPRRAVQ
jgi:hypothetical protein